MKTSPHFRNARVTFCRQITRCAVYLVSAHFFRKNNVFLSTQIIKVSYCI